ncbi:MAG: ABC transporter ATP-binding protein [Bacteroidota bacterium]
MKISLKATGKRYNYEWIFRNLDFTFQSDKSYAILGANGSGKSTLLQVIAGNIIPSTGEIFYHENENTIEPENFYQYITIASPYLELPEEMTLQELLHFHSGFKKFKSQLSFSDMIELSGFGKSSTRQIKHYSSGMKQRAKLMLAILSDTPVLLLDEPTTNLDEQGVQWWKNLMNEYAKNRLVIIASNIEREYDNCDEKILIADYK